MRSISESWSDSVRMGSGWIARLCYLVEFFGLLFKVVKEGGIFQRLLFGELGEVFLRFSHGVEYRWLYVVVK